MTHDSVLERIQPIFRDIFDDETLVVEDKTCADDIEDWDSLAQINIVVAMEKIFSLKFSLEDLKGIENVGDMVDLILVKCDL
jgi:acyl carrier protein